MAFHNSPSTRPVPIPTKVPMPPIEDSDDDSFQDKTLIVTVAVLSAILMVLLLLLVVMPRPTGSGGDGRETTGTGYGDQSEDGMGSSDANEVGDSGTEPEGMAKEPQTDGQTSEATTANDFSNDKSTSSITVTEGELREFDPSPKEPIREEQAAVMTTEDSQTSLPLSSGEGSGGGVTVRVFGVGGFGTKFMYVFDRSGSMGGQKLEEVKTELLRSISELSDRHQFNIIFYDDRYDIWKTGGKLISARPREKKEAEAFVREIAAHGGTEHLQPLLEAMKYKPEVIFFLTDGQALTQIQLEEISQKSGDICINVIQYDDGNDGESQILRQLASRNRGRYKYINVSASDAL